MAKLNDLSAAEIARRLINNDLHASDFDAPEAPDGGEGEPIDDGLKADLAREIVRTQDLIASLMQPGEKAPEPDQIDQAGGVEEFVRRYVL